MPFACSGGSWLAARLGHRSYRGPCKIGMAGTFVNAPSLLANTQRVASGPSYQMTLYDTLGRIYSAGLRYNS